MICPNMRAAQIYFRSVNASQFERAVTCALSDERVDQAIWRASLVDEDAAGFKVATRDRGTLHFWPAGAQADSGASSARDDFGNEWQWRGDLSAVDASVDSARLIYRDYPNALERLAGGVGFADGGHLWLTAAPGAEFLVPGGGVHKGGGSHAALHRLDSTTPVLLAGAPEGVELPRHFRSIDVMPLCLRMLGIA
jgi:hypothetical protein